MRENLTYNFCYILSQLAIVIELLKEILEVDDVVLHGINNFEIDMMVFRKPRTKNSIIQNDDNAYTYLSRVSLPNFLAW